MLDIVGGSITSEKLFYYFDRFLFSKESPEIDYESQDIYVLKKDISRLVNLLANDITSHALNKIVDKGIMTLCWDKKAKDFIWLEKK
jgi:hypothetical protein